MADESEQHEYSGPERRTFAALEDTPLSIKAVLGIAALVAGLVGWGIAWETAVAQLGNKVDVTAQMKVDADQNAKLLQIGDKLDLILPQVVHTDDRVSQMYCNTVPVNLRAGCK